MNRTKTVLLAFMAVLASLIIFSSEAFACCAVAYEIPPQANGQGLGNDNAGGKMTGRVSIAWMNYTYDTYGNLVNLDAIITAEISRGSDTEVFCGEIDDIDMMDIMNLPSIKNLIKDGIRQSAETTDGLGNPVYYCEHAEGAATPLEYFFPGTVADLTLVSMDRVNTQFSEAELAMIDFTASVK